MVVLRLLKVLIVFRQNRSIIPKAEIGDTCREIVVMYRHDPEERRVQSHPNINLSTPTGIFPGRLPWNNNGSKGNIPTENANELNGQFTEHPIPGS